MLKRAYVVPHPPIILPEVGRGEEKKIQETIDSVDRMSQEIAEIKPEVIIITSPHAPIYRDGFFLAKGKTGQGDLKNFGTPNVNINISYDQKLATELEAILSSQDYNIPIGSSPEWSQNLDHGTLIPLSFVQKNYQDFKVLRLGISELNAEAHYKLGQAITEALKQLKCTGVFIASGDLSHVLKADGPYGFDPAGPAFDQKILDILLKADFESLLAISDKELEKAAQCGTNSFQIMAGALDGKDLNTELYSYQDTFGVGYATISFEPVGDNPDRKFLENEGAAPSILGKKPYLANPYVGLAKSTIEEYTKSGKIINIPQDLPEEMTNAKAGAFVSIHKQGQLRGCIGTIGPTTDSIAEEIRQNAISASTRDPRFSPIKADELEDLEISVDILEKAEQVASLDDLDPELYGVIVSKDQRKGLLLPMLEGVDTAQEQVLIALQKAGISPDEEFMLERFMVIRHE